MVVAFYNHKGGVGKTTLCSSVGFLAIEKKVKLKVLDTDPQHNTIEYLCNHDWNGDSEVIKGNVTLTTEHEGIGNENLIIDAPPTSYFQNFLKTDKIDLIVVPMDGRFSMKGLMDIVQFIKSNNLKAEILVVLNKVESHIRLAKSEKQEAEKLGVNIFDLHIPQHSIVRQAELLGKAVWQVPYGIRSKSAQNMKAFSEYILRRINNGR